MKIEEIQPKPFECHQSSISTAHGCERCWFFKERWGVILRGVKVKESADLGKIYHKFQQLGPENQNLVRPWVRGIQTDLMERADRGEDLDGEMVRKANLLTTSYNKARAMAQLFWERYPTPKYLKTMGSEIKHTVTFSQYSCSLTGLSPVPAGLIGMVLTGTIDKIILDERNGNIWIRDHKSSGMKSLKPVFAGFKWSPQARIYRILAEDYCLKNHFDTNKRNSITGFILDGILKPGIKLCKKDIKNAKEWQCSEEEAYLRRVKEWYAEKDLDAIRSEALMFNEPLFSRELTQELLFMKELASRANDPSEYNRDPSRYHCSLYESECVYMDLCQSPKAKWQELFEIKYKIKSAEEENEE